MPILFLLYIHIITGTKICINFNLVINMNNRTSVRVLRAFASRWLDKAESDTKRSLRKLVEFGCYFSGSTQINSFFNEAHDILKSSNSKYYVLAHNLIKSVDKNRTTEFGIAFGYNGFVKGMNEIRSHFSANNKYKALVAIIRNIDDTLGLNANGLSGQVTTYSQNGTAIFFIFCDDIGIADGELKITLDSNSQKAFFLFTDNEEIVMLNNQNNVMAILNLCSDNFAQISEILIKQKRLFGAYCRYNDENADEIISKNFLDTVKARGCLFLFLVEDDGCSESCHEKVNQFSFHQKRKPTHPIFISELFSDLKWLNDISCKNEIPK